MVRQEELIQATRVMQSQMRMKGAGATKFTQPKQIQAIFPFHSAAAPTEGSKSMSQISPRFGVGAVDMQVLLAECFECRQLLIRKVIVLGQLRRRFQNRVAFSWWKFS
jgi:hypothetical protein